MDNTDKLWQLWQLWQTCAKPAAHPHPLLQVLGGKHMVPESAVRVLGQPPFHATGLTSSGALSYVGGNWERDIAFAGYSIPLAVSAAACIESSNRAAQDEAAPGCTQPAL